MGALPKKFWIFWWGVLIIGSIAAMNIPPSLLPRMSLPTITLGFDVTPSMIKDLRWSRYPGTLALSPVQKDGSTGTLLIRLTDGVEQFFPGTWKVTQTPFDNTILYGTSPQSEEYLIYYIYAGRKIIPIIPPREYGAVLSVSENRKNTYLILEQMTEGEESMFCLYQRVGGTDSLCRILPVSQVRRVSWNPSRDHELFIKTRKEELYRYDPWEEEAQPVQPADSEYQEIKDLLAHPAVAWDSDDERASLFVLPLFFLARAKNFIGLYREPRFVESAHLVDNNHILVKTADAVAIFELSSRKYVRLLDASSFVNSGTVVDRSNQSVSF